VHATSSQLISDYLMTDHSLTNFQ